VDRKVVQGELAALAAVVVALNHADSPVLVDLVASLDFKREVLAQLAGPAKAGGIAELVLATVANLDGEVLESFGVCLAVVDDLMGVGSVACIDAATDANCLFLEVSTGPV